MAKHNHQAEADLCRRSNAAEDVLPAITLADDDTTVANAAAGWLLTPPWRFSVMHDMSKAAVKKVRWFIDRCRTGYRDDLPYWLLQELHTGEPLLDFDWKRKGTIGIKTSDEHRAREWLLSALMLDYMPMLTTTGSLVVRRHQTDSPAHPPAVARILAALGSCATQNRNDKGPADEARP